MDTLKNTKIEKVFLFHKIIQIIMAVHLILLSVVRILFMEASHVTSFMVSVYWCLFGLMFIFVEFDIKKSRLWFYFLNTALGKGLFHIFCFLMCFGSGDARNWVDVYLAVVFSFTSTIFLIMHCFFKDIEGPYIESLVNAIRQPKQPTAPLANQS